MDQKVKLAIIIIISITIGWFGNSYYKSLQSKNESLAIRENSDEYKFINPLLIGSGSEETYPELNPLKNKIKDYVSKNISNNNAINISVYYRDLNTSESTGVNEDDLYSPGSMLKISTLITYLKLADEDQKILTDNIYYKFIDNQGQYYKPTPLKEGSYPAITLLQQMIVQSDNTAMDILDERHIKDIVGLYEKLQLPDPINSPTDFMSPKEYSKLFRILFNSTYLSRSYSEQALELLSFTSFNKGINRDLPKNIVISHKFGEQTITNNNSIEYRELHDCGIIYFPKNPYLVCIMTKGSNFSKLENIVSDISKITYDHQKENAKN